MKRTALTVAAAALTIGTLTGPAAAAVRDPAPPLSSQTGVQSTQSDRAVSLNRPSRGGSARIIVQAATVPPNIRGFAACVLWRESKGTLDRIQSGVGARNPSSSAQGRWQFINSDWQHSLPWHVRDRLVQFGMPKAQANEIRRYLDKRPIATWHGYWQDIGFVETMERGGAHHWNGPGC